MYGGIITKSGEILQNSGDENGHKLVLKSSVAKMVREGDSVGVNGVCLTVTSFDDETTSFDVWPETLKRTTLESLSVGEIVHVDLPLKHGEFIGGHNILGHVDFVSPLVEATEVEGSDQLKLWFGLDRRFDALIPVRGSVAVDGVSLTITDRRDDAFSVSLIPETLERTHLDELKLADKVNIEVDYNARQLQDESGVLALSFSEDVRVPWQVDELAWTVESLKNGSPVILWDALEGEAALVCAGEKLTAEVLIFVQSLARTPLMVALSGWVSERLAIPAPVINHPLEEDGRRYLVAINHLENPIHDFSAKAILKTISLFTDTSKAIGDWKCPGNVPAIQVYSEELSVRSGNLEIAVKLMEKCDFEKVAVCMAMLAADGSSFNKEQAEIAAARFNLPLLDISTFQ
ncbi:MAG: riboflavin synthase [Lentisphaeraceae bacterium]|nr:riboflavin synthase [Lentisphaeraceae bacterium]